MKKKSICLALLLAGLFLMTGFMMSSYNVQVAYAATKGTVTTTGLRVRTDAGTDKAVLTHNGANVALIKGAKVTIHSEKSVKGVTWYEVTFTHQGDNLRGYVSGDYVKVESSGGQSNSGNTAGGDNSSTGNTSGTTTNSGTAKMSIPAKITADSLNVRTGPSTSDAKLSVNGKSVSLKKGTVVRIVKEVKNGEQEWYQVSFTYDNKTVKGYVLSDYTNLVLTRDVSALTSTGKVKLYKKAGTDKKVKKLNGKKIDLAKGTEVLIIKETKDANGAKWFKVKCGYKGVMKQGFIPASNLALNKVIPLQGKVTTDNLRVRTGAGTNNGQLMLNNKAVLLKKGQVLTISAQTKVSNVTWYKVNFVNEKKTVTGYVSGEYVELMKYTLDLGTPDKEENENTGSESNGNEGSGGENTGNENTGNEGSSGENTGNENTGNEGSGGENTGNGNTGNEGSGGENTGNGNTGNEGSGAENTGNENTGNNNTGNNNAGGNSGNASGGSPSGEVIKDMEAFLTEQRFPESYKSGLRALHAAHPTWVFKAYHTGLNWEDAVKNESQVGLNLISNNKTNGWKSYEDKAYQYPTDKFVAYDGSTWVTASKEAVAYYMDPRNFMTERGMFQFLTLEYQSDHETIAGVENILANTPLYNTSYTYMDKTQALEVSKTYAQTFMDAAAKSGVSPYHLATRVKQEVVTNSTTLSGSASGKFAGYEGYYNFYNIGATHSTQTGGAVANGLNFAMGNKSSEAAKLEYSLPWNNQYDAIVGGAAYIGSQYINRGQNTIYLQKFNVTPNSTYTHQYMANVEAANSEAIKLYNGYASVLNTSLVFYIPVYENMPEEKAPVPGNVPSPNNWLKSLKVGEYVLTPEFNADAGSAQPYVLSLELEDVTEVNLEAVAANKKATILVTQINNGNLSIVSNTGNAVINLQTGLNEIEILVTAENGIANVYKVTITK